MIDFLSLSVEQRNRLVLEIFETRKVSVSINDVCVALNVDPTLRGAGYNAVQHSIDLLRTEGRVFWIAKGRHVIRAGTEPPVVIDVRSPEAKRQQSYRDRKKEKTDGPRDATMLVPFLRDELGWVSSLEIAKRAGKRHDNVMVSIRRVMMDAGTIGALNFKDTEYADTQNKRRPAIEVSEIALPAVLGAIGGDIYTPLLFQYAEEFRALKLASQKPLPPQTSSDAAIDRLFERLAERDDKREARADERHRQTLQFMHDENKQLIVAIGNVHAPSSGNPGASILPFDKAMVDGEYIPNTKIRKLIAGQTMMTELAAAIASLMKVHFGAGGYTADRQKKYLEEAGIVLRWDRIVYLGQEMIVPVPADGYEGWFGAYLTARAIVNQDVHAGPSKWQWCFTDAGSSAMRTRWPEILKWYNK